MSWSRTARWFLVLVLAAAAFGAGRSLLAAPAAPIPVAPASGTRLSSMEVTVSWALPPGATQYQLQVLPFNGDGPAINLVRNAESWFTIPAPPMWYVLLPDMTYTWRVRASDKATSAAEDDPSWGPWSATQSFRTPSVSSDGVQAVYPPDGAPLESAAPVTLRWSHPDPAVFYYEVQVSRDPAFTTDPATATSFVWWVLRHGGATAPANSWTVPVLERGSTYYWRVRPRVQGDGVPVAWGPTWTFTTPPLTRLAFASDREGNSEIYLMNADGTAPVRLTVNPARDRQPALSPDGQRIAFVSDREGNDEIYVMNSDGSGVTRLTTNPARDESPAWSPDGHDIVFVSERDGNANIYRMVADGTGLMRLTDNPARDESPAWSPDGSAIAFVSDREGRKQIYLMRWDGSGQVNRRQSAANDFDPAWSPTDGRLAFASDRDGNVEIYYTRVDAAGDVRLTNNPTTDRRPVWAPDSSTLAFVSDRTGNWEIFMMQPDGAGPVNRTNNPASDTDPSWPTR